MKILHVASDLAQVTGGPPVAITNNAEALRHRGHHVEISAIAKNGTTVDLAAPTAAGVTVHLHKPTGPRRIGLSIQQWRFLIGTIRDKDIVIIHSLYLCHLLIAAGLCLFYKVPYVVQPHGSLDPYIHKRHRFRKVVVETLGQNQILRRAAAIWYTTAEERDLASKFTGNDRSIISPPLIDYSRYRKLAAEDVCDRSDRVLNDGKILFLGRVNFKKGLDIVLDGFARIADNIPGARLQIVGPVDADMWPQLRARERRHGLAERIDYVGLVEGEAKLAVLRDAAVFVLPSYSENFGIAVVEAIAAGLPVIISDRVNLHPAVTASGCGVVVAPDAAMFGDALRTVLTEPDRWQAYSSRCDTCMDEFFDRQTLLGELERQLLAAAGWQERLPSPPLHRVA